MMNQDAVINKLLDKAVIRKAEVRGHYYIADITTGQTFRRNAILARFALEVAPARYLIKEAEVARALGRPVGPRPLRHLHILGYSQSNHGAQDSSIEAALSRIALDEDGVRRSFGVEYEIYTMTMQQQSDLAYLLDEMPAHTVHSDGSLGTGGVEVVFKPVDAATYIRIVKKMGQFIRENNIRMEKDSFGNGAGMHTTYGVSNGEASKSDLQIRLNRFALAVKACGTQGAIKEMFGRDFGSYRTLPNSTTSMDHSNAFSTNGRPACCWECRLPSWRCNPEKMIEFFKATEVAFHRPVEAQDFMKVFEIMGSNTQGC